MLVLLALVVLLVVVTVAIAVVGLVVPLAEDNVDGVVLCIVVFFVGRGLVEVSKWDVVM